MNIGDRIEYQVCVATWGVGRVVAYDENTEIVTVEDADDGTTWRGLADQTQPSEE
jgi:hypothetical protein